MHDTDIKLDDFINVEHVGEGFAAGCRLLQARYHLADEAAFLIAAAVVATAAGPSPRVRDPLGGDLPLSLDLVFCADARSTVPAAISDAFRFFRHAVSQKVLWRETVGSRRLRADFIETLTALELVEQQIRHASASLTPPTSMPVPAPDQDEIIRRTKLEHENRVARRDQLRAELAERRMDLGPFLVGEDPGWDTVLSMDKLSFDNAFTSISPEGAAFRELLSSTPKQVGRISRLLQASRHGRSLTDGAAVMLNPVLTTVHVATPEWLSAALRNRSIREGGFLSGCVLEIPETTAAFDADAFVDDTNEKQWEELMVKLFTHRSRAVPQLYMLDRGGFNILDDFRRWCRLAVVEYPGFDDLVAAWHGLVLKLALCIHLAAGKEEPTLDLVTLGYVAATMKAVGAKQLQLLNGLLQPPASPETRIDPVAYMVAKLAALGGTATVRDLFRGYSGQDYTLLTPILERAVVGGHIIREVKRLWLPPVPAGMA